MKNTILTLLFVMALPATMFSQKTFKVMAYNIYHGATMSDNYDMDLFTKIINSESPDLVALQEVDFKTRRSGGLDLASEIGLRCKMAPLFARTMSYDGGEYGIAILSKYPILESKQIALPGKSDEEPRRALMVKVAIDTDTIWFISTHFGYQYEDTQIKQAELLTAVAAGLNHPAIMGGDLNAEPGSTPIHYLDNNWLATYDPNNIEFTFPADNPEKKIDFLYCYPKNKWNVLSDKVIRNNDTKEASDHLPYAATVELK